MRSLVGVLASELVTGLAVVLAVDEIMMAEGCLIVTLEVLSQMRRKLNSPVSIVLEVLGISLVLDLLRNYSPQSMKLMKDQA